MGRQIEIWTWDAGARQVDVDAPDRFVVPVLETVILGGLWKEFRKFPTDVLVRLLPSLDVPPNLRRLVEIWIEENSTVA